jgi:hypothetical protein
MLKKVRRIATKFWWEWRKPQPPCEIERLKMALKKAQRDHKATKHIYRQAKAVTTMRLKTELRRYP